MQSPYFFLSSVRGVIFDWDGVIADTLLDFGPIRKKYFSGRRVPLLEAANSMPEPLRSELLDDIRSEEMRGAAFSVPVEGTSRLIEFLDGRGIPWCVLSRNCRESIDLAARTIHFDLPSHVFSREAPHVKPDPRSMMDAASALGVPPENCLVIGDFLYELQAARRAGMRCILVRQDDAECAALADASFPTMTGLLEAFSNDRPIVPWEYHPSAARYGTSALNLFARQTIHIDCQFCPAAVQRLHELAALGVGAFTVDYDRFISTDEFRLCAGFAPLCLNARAVEALKAEFASRWPLLSVTPGAEGSALSSIVDVERYALGLLG